MGCFGPAMNVADRAEKLIAKTQNLSTLSSGEKKRMFEFLSLFLGVPLMAGFELSADILKQIKTKGEVQSPLGGLPAVTKDIASNLLQ